MMKTRRPVRILFCSVLVALLIFACYGGAGVAAGGNMQLSYATPQDAVQALVEALKAGDVAKVSNILGPGSGPLISSGDPVADRAGKEEFLKLYEEQHKIESTGADKAVLSIGSQDYPVPIPLVKGGNGWLFDTAAGLDEILNRRIGRNELKAIQVAHAYVEAQREYAARLREPKHPAEYAQRLFSSPGKKDGLYWKTGEGEEESPMGPLVAQAAREGYVKSKGPWPVPFHGYYFRILKGQGKHASGGAMNYLVKGRMVRGFGMLAYPANYGNSGIMTFIVNQEGVVYQKDLGANTARIATGIRLFDPDKSWKEVGGDEEHLPTVSDVEPPKENSGLK